MLPHLPTIKKATPWNADSDEWDVNPLIVISWASSLTVALSGGRGVGRDAVGGSHLLCQPTDNAMFRHEDSQLPQSPHRSLWACTVCTLLVFRITPGVQTVNSTPAGGVSLSWLVFWWLLGVRNRFGSHLKIWYFPQVRCQRHRL